MVATRFALQVLQLSGQAVDLRFRFLNFFYHVNDMVIETGQSLKILLTLSMDSVLYLTVQQYHACPDGDVL